MNQLDTTKINYQQSRQAHGDAIACKLDTWTTWGEYYHRRLAEIYQFLVAPGERVLEIGCGRGDLLAALKPKVGVGVDFSSEMIKRAVQRHPQLRFIQADTHDINLEEKFDVIILSDLVNDLWDIQTAFEQIAKVSTPRTRIIINFYSRLWELPLSIGQRLGISKPVLPQNWLTVDDISGLLRLADFEVIREWQEILLPLPVPLIATFFNRCLVKVWPFKFAALTNFIVARPFPKHRALEEKPKVSVIIPARNEAGNISDIFARMPEMGRETELIFVEGYSTDNTYAVLKQTIANYPQGRYKLLQQTGKGKADAVRLGFAHASGDILMILDADLTVSPEDLTRCYDVLYLGKGDFVNGVRLVYPMEEQAMQNLNLVVNKCFSLVFSWLLGQPVKDTLCGTKALWKFDYERIAVNRAYCGDFDPFGDFDLLFGAAKLNLKIVDLPVRYRQRTYGKTNIQRWKHGWLLLQIVLFATRRLKFV